ncbi:unnamed protein product, partial [Sphacelaria rigidula]
MVKGGGLVIVAVQNIACVIGQSSEIWEFGQRLTVEPPALDMSGISELPECEVALVPQRHDNGRHSRKIGMRGRFLACSLYLTVASTSPGLFSKQGDCFLRQNVLL